MTVSEIKAREVLSNIVKPSSVKKISKEGAPSTQAGPAIQDDEPRFYDRNFFSKYA